MNARMGEDASNEESSDGEGLDLAKILMFIGFFLRAPRRRPVLAALVSGVAVVLTLVVAVVLPRSYESEMRVLAHRNRVLPAVDGQPPTEPTKGIVDEVMQRDSLTKLMKQLDLETKWEQTRPPILRFKDTVVAALFGKPSDDVKRRALVGMLEHSVAASVEQDSFTLGADWPEPHVALDIVNTVYQNFLDTRYKSEVNVFSERLRLSELRAQLSAQAVDDAVQQLTKQIQTVAEEKAKAAGVVAAPVGEQGTVGAAAPTVVPKDPAAKAVVADFETAHTLEQVRAQIHSLEEDHRRRLTEATSQLADAQSTLGPLNPTVIALKQKLDASQAAPAELNALRDQEKSLIAQLTATTTPEGGGARAPSGGGSPSVPRLTPGGAPTPDVVQQLRELINGPDDPGLAYRKAKLQAASQEYNEVLNQSDFAKVQLEIARDAFRDTYTIARPAELATKPKKPKIPLIVGGGLLAALLLAFLIPGLRDLASRRVIEVWQVEAFLKVPVLGEVAPSSLILPK
jgi:uncharacterized protein involved in exopolysaccharide biosynthesis